MIEEMKGMEKKGGIKTDVVKTNTYSDFGNMLRPMNGGEKEILQHYVDRGYELFIDRCASGRHMTDAAIEKIAEGRVWTGEMALGLGLVDVLGGLNTALEIAVEKADIEAYTVCTYPAKEDFISSLFNKTKSTYVKSEILKGQVGEIYNHMNFIRDLDSKAKIQARMPFEPNIK